MSNWSRPIIARTTYGERHEREVRDVAKRCSVAAIGAIAAQCLSGVYPVAIMLEDRLSIEKFIEQTIVERNTYE